MQLALMLERGPRPSVYPLYAGGFGRDGRRRDGRGLSPVTLLAHHRKRLFERRGQQSSLRIGKLSQTG